MPWKLELHLDPPPPDGLWPEVRCELLFEQRSDLAEERYQGVHEVSVLMN